jgi:polar amino acid transport system substrate-binding protein
MALPQLSRRALVLLAALVLPAAQAPAEAAPGSQTCVLAARWEQQPPYGVRLPDGRRSGYYAEAVREAGHRIGCRIDFVEMPWGRGLRELEAGRLDVVAGALRALDRERYAYFSRPINLSPNLLFLDEAAAASWPLRSLQELAETPLRVGVEAGANYGGDYQRLLDDPRFVAHLHTVADRTRGWRMLRDARLDGMIADQGSAFVEGLGLSSGRHLVPVLVVSSMPAHVMLGRHRDESLARRLDEALEAMVAEGWLPQLREAWIPCAADPATMGCRTGERIEAAMPPVRARGARDAARLSPPSR